MFSPRRLVYCGLFLGVFVGNAFCGISFTLCLGPSMLPTIKNQILLVDKFSHVVLRKPYMQYDVVQLVSPVDCSKLICKRITGVAGDKRWSHDHTPAKDLLLILNTRYKLDPSGSLSEEVVIPHGFVWVTGDNPEHSRDSRHFGPVPLRLLMGQVRALNLSKLSKEI